MPRKTIEMLCVVEAYTGDGDGSYDRKAVYDDVDDLLRDVRAALEAGRDVLLQPTTMSASEYEAGGQEFPEGVNPLLPT